MNGSTVASITKRFEGWFAASFWVDVHYGLAALGTLIVFWQGATNGFNLGFAGYVAAMWVTAVGNDKVNMPDAKA